MSLFNSLGSSRRAYEELGQGVKDAIDSSLSDSWGRIPESWRTTMTPAQVEDFLSGQVQKISRAYPESPIREVIIYLLGRAESLISTGGSGGSGNGAVLISPDIGNRLEKRFNGLYVKPNTWNSKEW